MRETTSKVFYFSHLFLIMAGVSIAIVVFGCGSEDEKPNQGFAHVLMVDNAFSPPMQRIHVGGQVEFLNTGANPHNAISVDKSWSTEKNFGNIVMPSGAKVKITYPKEGVFPYFCSFHAAPDGSKGMVADIVVGDVPYNPAKRIGKQWKSVEKFSGRTLHVPKSYPTIQNAVDAAFPGDLILISEGIYYEEVIVTTPSLVLRGMDRNRTILDGQFQRGNGVMVVSADGVVVENMTARNYKLNGFFWTGVKGYRGSYLTAYNNGDYGIYAFDSINGVLEHSYASGSPDSGFYVGQCYPCKAILYDLISENSALGYSGSNAGGELYILSSVWKNNITGIAPNSLDTELLPPERETTIIGNLVYDNNNRSVPVKPFEYPSYGTGILIAGGQKNVIKKNVVIGNANYGISIFPNLEESLWLSHLNIVEDNIVYSSGLGDLVVSGPISIGNCFSNNKFQTSIPPLLEKTNPCSSRYRFPSGGELFPIFNAISLAIDASHGDYPKGDWRKQPIPPEQKTLPLGATSPVKPAVHPFEDFPLDLDHVALPEEATLVLAERTPKRGNIFGSFSLPKPLNLRVIIIRWLGYILPLILYVCLVSLSLKDLTLRSRSESKRTLWVLFTSLVPFVGGATYLLFGKSSYPKHIRYTLLGVGFGVYFVFLIYLGIELSGSAAPTDFGN
ncbi:plastocyanin [Leptospira hartskeerlii]|uniref:Plastocyanin n=1 Tax=Leptospira hartskeerlii TaxID=2023177 RepID=A0A2M9XDA6_9LEPT|nr:PLDc N-terminal domain-containing protein [Leptospira hartskeerlii]PJZ25683.1 plastocyanin [Leptospira hartskeerlii]PJZ35494.1 plastocyanin [Leptospira hartskeerlii]